MQLAIQEKPGCMSTDYDAEMLSVYWYMLQGLCDSKGITLVMMLDDVRGWPSWIFDNHPEAIKPEYYNQTNWIDLGKMWSKQERHEIYALDPPHDKVHFSEEGHIKLADDLEVELNKLGVL